VKALGIVAAAIGALGAMLVQFKLVQRSLERAARVQPSAGRHRRRHDYAVPTLLAWVLGGAIFIAFPWDLVLR
jgi:hypothetical protein